ncbi:MAG TPA: phage holin family protein, partial [Patescibacteria group bacterium]|nr:phage holin family protein [Patescibacteria group bacterium]
IALFLGLLNLILRPILIVLTLPITMLTFGLFIFVINTLLILLISTIIQGFSVAGFLPALLFSIVLSATSYILNYVAEYSRKK